MVLSRKLPTAQLFSPKKTETFSCHLLVRTGRSSEHCGWLGTNSAPFIKPLMFEKDKDATWTLKCETFQSPGMCQINTSDS